MLAGLGLGVLEIALTLGGGWSLFLGHAERWRFVIAALPACVTVALAGWTTLAALRRFAERRSDDPLRTFGRVLGGFTGLVSAALGWSVTSGRRVATASWRELVVIGGAVLTSLAVAYVAKKIAASPPRAWASALLGGVAALAMAVDAFVLPRLYPAFHVGLALLALAAALAAVQLAPLGPRSSLWPLRLGKLLIAAAAVGAVAPALWVLDRAPNAGFVARTRAPVTGKLLALVPPRPIPSQERAADLASTPRPAREGIDLRGRDILLITVDALRADRLGAYGGPPGLTPALDALADESVVFQRAYTPTPHTSYALTSMLTGKFMREVLELERTRSDECARARGAGPSARSDAAEDAACGAHGDHPALPELLRDYGYRTAAFYPPAIFFVDAHRFAGLSRRAFGFEYRKVMFAKAPHRVAQVDTYLDEVDPSYPVFVWVHLFEPHEPYDPPERFARGDDTVSRYEGEVAAVDDAIGELVALFRRRRPGSTVIITADHGEELGDHGGWYHGTTLYDEQVRVPLLWSSPDVAPPRSTHAPVELVDLAPTLLSALGIPRDARMRGDDLGAVLAGDDEAAPPLAFASIGTQRMVTDGALKLVCDGAACRLFDLVDDPGELRDVARERAGDVARLHAGLRRFLASVPEVEAMALEGDAAWPSALARAALGDVGAAEDLVPLLRARRPPVRAAAARALGELEHLPAKPALARLWDDEDGDVRAEAAIASLVLGDDDAATAARGALDGHEERARRAALALAHRGDAAGVEALRRLAVDDEADEADRVAAIRALGALGDRGAVATLAALLEDVRLRPEAIRALGAVGGPLAADAIAAAFARERYLGARGEHAAALFALGDRRAATLTRRFLGMDRPVPGGVRLLLDAGQLERGGGGLDVRRAGRGGTWRCDAAGCVPGEGATLLLPTAGPTGPTRVVVLATGRGALTVGGEHAEVDGDTQISLPLESSRGARLAVSGDAAVVAVAIVPATEELPPPPPEPWGDDADAL